MNKPHVRHAGCGGLLTASEGRIVCAQCLRDVPNQLEWVHERLSFKAEQVTTAVDQVRA